MRCSRIVGVRLGSAQRDKFFLTSSCFFHLDDYCLVSRSFSLIPDRPPVNLLRQGSLVLG
jgi:hypothetical protein